MDTIYNFFYGPKDTTVSHVELDLEQFHNVQSEELNERCISELAEKIITANFSQSTATNFLANVKAFQTEFANIKDEQFINNKELFQRIYQTFVGIQALIKNQGIAVDAEFTKTCNHMMTQFRTVFSTDMRTELAEIASFCALRNDITSFCELSNELVLSGISEENLLVMYNQRLLSFSNCKNTSSEDQQLVFDKLLQMGNHLSKKKIIEKVTDDQLLNIKLIACASMIGYLSQQKTGLDLLEANFNQLVRINSLVQAEIKKRGDLFEASRDFKQFFESLITQIKSKLYLDSFWSDEKNSLALVGIQSIIEPIIEYMNDPKTKKLGNLVHLESDVVTGSVLFQDAEGEYVLMLKDNESLIDHYNPTQSREKDGLAHGPITAEVNRISEKVHQLLEKHCKETKKVTITGFGLAGAVAQQIASCEAKENSGIEYIACSIGTAPYLDLNAAAALKVIENLKSINFILIGDSYTRTSVFSRMVARNASIERCWDTVFPLYNRNWFASDITGHDKKIYSNGIANAVKQPVEMYEVCEQSEEFAF